MRDAAPFRPNPPDQFAATLDSVPQDSLVTAEAPAPAPALVQGSAPRLTQETESLLRVRLQAASLVLATTIGVFFLLANLYPPKCEHYQVDLLSCVEFLYWLHLVVLLILGGLAAALWSKQPLLLADLRKAELLAFGSLFFYFLIVQNVETLSTVEHDRFLLIQPARWQALIFVYALFIPNPPRRAAVVLGLMSAAPVAVVGFEYFRYPQLAAVLTAGSVVRLAAFMAFAFAAALYGTYLIGNLRRKEFQARQLNQYRLKDLLGAGGMGEVYLAEHLLLKRPCAIKLIRPGKEADPQAIARFEREVRTTARLSHWNTVEIFDYGRADDGTFYYVMEYLPGLSLQDLVARHGRLPAARVVHLMRQACDALAEAHAVGLIHRDLKPANIIAAERGGVRDVAKLVDFGLAKPVVHGPGNADLTQEGVVSGSPMYMSPEQALGGAEPDERGDLYALGAVMFYLLTARPPFPRQTVVQVLVAHVHDAPPRPSEFAADVPPDLESIVLKCLAKRPDERFASARDLGRALAACAAADRWSRDEAESWWRAHAADCLPPSPRFGERGRG